MCLIGIRAPKPLAILSYRVKTIIYLGALTLIGLLYCDFGKAWRLCIYVVSLYPPLVAIYRRLVADRVELSIIRDVVVDPKRNNVDVNFIEATDRYVEADCYYAGRNHHVEIGNLGLAYRAVAAVTTLDVRSLTNVIYKDHNSGDESLRLRANPGTLTLAVCLALKREK